MATHRFETMLQAEAKREAARRRRVAQAVEMLRDGRRHP
jgi:hypothetical protein